MLNITTNGTPKQLCFIVVVVIVACGCQTRGATQALPGCLERCGSLTIPYPFGVGDGCYLRDGPNPKFNISCENTTGSPLAYLGNINITQISLIAGELQLWQYRGFDCYDKNGFQNEETQKYSPYLDLTGFFTISTQKNKFFALGCDTYALIEGIDEDGETYTTGCMSICNTNKPINYKSCDGAGCCETTIPRGLETRNLRLDSYYNHTYVWSFNPCSYAFIVEKTRFNFSETSLDYLNKTDRLPLIVDWSIGNKSCDQVESSGTLVCKGNSDCVNSTNRSGYLCQCKQGFEGNPYHPDGCRDIDECKDSTRCINGMCTNKPGGFNCTCFDGYINVNESCREVNNRNDNPVNNHNDNPVNNRNDNPQRRAHHIYIPLSLSVGLIAVFAGSLMLCCVMRKRKLIKLKEKFFEQNGGLMLQRRLSSEHGSSLETTRIFSAEELKSATNNYDKSRVVGEGGNGTVYKGILANNMVVAIKKPKSIGAQNVDPGQFINEVVVLMQINHRNVVRLLGCCLETEAPILVYEFITNGTLFQHLHNKDSESESSLSWELRLKIAAETAGALAYLHAETSIPIIHRDVKTMNILVDENYTAKVADFGTSRLVPLDHEAMSTFVQGTLGYLDPEYMQSSVLTEKSDVYSFGVVLAELLTGKKALTFVRLEGVSNLAMSFVSLMKDDQLLQLIDNSIVDDTNMEAIKEVAILTKRCLSLKGADRPTMKEVAMELEGLRITRKHVWGKDDNLLHSEETEYLLGPPSIPHSLDIESGSSITTAGYDIMQTQSMLMPHNNDAG